MSATLSVEVEKLGSQRFAIGLGHIREELEAEVEAHCVDPKKGDALVENGSCVHNGSVMLTLWLKLEGVGDKGGVDGGVEVPGVGDPTMDGEGFSVCDGIAERWFKMADE